MADDKIQALVAAQIRREMEQADETTRPEKRPTGETRTARDLQDARQVEREEVAVIDEEMEGIRTAADWTRLTSTKKNKVRTYI